MSRTSRGRRHDSRAVVAWLLAGFVVSQLAMAVTLERVRPDLRDPEYGHKLRLLRRQMAADWTDLPELELTGRVILESMRLYPPGWILLRSVTTATRLADHILPAGTMVLFSPYVLHRHPESFERPERFEPQRWLAAVPRHAYVPFGGGATRCVGEQFALAETSLALASILGRWTPSLVDPHRPPPTSLRLVLAPRRLPVHLHHREAPAGND